VLFKSKMIPVSEAARFPDLSKIDPVYDNVNENSSVIELWRKQLISSKSNLSDTSSATALAVEAELEKKHNIKYPSAPYHIPVEENLVDYKDAVPMGDELYWSPDLGISFADFTNLTKKVLLMRRTVQMTRKGKIPSMTALVVVGNCRGGAGYGEGKDSEAPKAILKATRKAIRNITYFHRYDDRTIYHDIYYKYKASKLFFWARKPGFGCKVNPVIHEVAKCIGIDDLAGKCRGSRNPMNVVKGTFEALASQKLPQVIARSRGIRLVDVQHTYYGKN
ncbi:putative 37S ribosomal protein S5, mitochondrial, partial [Smittium culicis]